MKLKIRNCKLNDYNFIYKITKITLFPYIHEYFKPSKRKFDEGFNRDYKKIKIIISGNKRIGFYEVKKTKNNLEINKIFISPSYQGKGIGKSLMNSFENKGLKLIRLQVWENNPAKNFYKKLGYKKILKKGHKIFMEKRLR